MTSSQTCHSCTWSKHLLPVLINKHVSTLSTCSFILSLLVSGYSSDHLQLSALPLHSPPSLPEECAHCALPSIRLVIGRSGPVGEDCVGLGSFPCSDYPGLLGGTRSPPFRPPPPPSPPSPLLTSPLSVHLLLSPFSSCMYDAYVCSVPRCERTEATRVPPLRLQESQSFTRQRLFIKKALSGSEGFPGCLTAIGISS